MGKNIKGRNHEKPIDYSDSDSGRSGKLSEAEIQNRKNVYLVCSEPKFLKGTEHLTKLKLLHCCENQLKPLDLSACKMIVVRQSIMQRRIPNSLSIAKILLRT